MYSYDRNARDPDINWSVVRTVANRVIRNIGKPAPTRAGALQQIAKALADNDVVMQALASEVKSGSFNYTLEDTIGEVVAGWKEDWEIHEDNPKYDGLSVDPALAKMVQGLAVKWVPKGPIVQPRDYSEANRLVSQYRGLSDLLQRLSGGGFDEKEEDAARLEAHRRALQVAELLK